VAADVEDLSVKQSDVLGIDAAFGGCSAFPHTRVSFLPARRDSFTHRHTVIPFGMWIFLALQANNHQTLDVMKVGGRQLGVDL
jgi:hypothetical protein